MKVIFIPDYSKGNPYQKALADSLSKERVEVSFSTNFRLYSVLSSVKNHWKPDILHVHWLHPFLLSSSRGKTILKSISFIGYLLKLKLFGIKIVWTVHNILSHEGEFSSLELFFSKILAKLCNKLIVHCPSAKREVMKVYGVSDSSIAVIPHGNYIHSYKNVIGKAQARERLKISTEIVFLYFGQIRPYKGIDELIDASEKLNFPKAELLIVGKPYNKEIAVDIKKKCKNKNIKTIFKFITDDELQVYMNASDIVVLPYKDLLTSGAVILAMSFGKPIIAPAIGCISDILDDKSSFLYRSEENGLLEAMQRALNTDVENLKSMGEHNFELAKQLEWSDIAKGTYEVYRECLRRKIQRIRFN